MDAFKLYEIAFVGLKKDLHVFDYQLDDSFFELFETQREFSDSSIKAIVSFEKESTFFKLRFDIGGTVDVVCDLSDELFSLPIKGTYNLVVRFGETYSDDGEDLVFIPHGSHCLNVAQWIYETVLLAIPIKRVNPNIKKKESVFEPKIDPSYKETDPRWDKLKDLLTD